MVVPVRLLLAGVLRIRRHMTHQRVTVAPHFGKLSLLIVCDLLVKEKANRKRCHPKASGQNGRSHRDTRLAPTASLKAEVELSYPLLVLPRCLQRSGPSRRVA